MAYLGDGNRVGCRLGRRLETTHDGKSDCDMSVSSSRLGNIQWPSYLGVGGSTAVSVAAMRLREVLPTEHRISDIYINTMHTEVKFRLRSLVYLTLH